MEKLIAGLRTFADTHHPSERDLYERLARGQSPDTMFITCSDSRVCPTTLTSSRPGELFVLRNAGNIVPPPGVEGGEAATLEYAVAVLKVRDIVVCGHSDCGAMKGVLDPDAVASLPSVSRWLSHSEDVARILRGAPALPASERLARAIEINVLTQLTHLRSHPAVAAALERGRLALHGWVLDIGPGRVRAFDAKHGGFVDLLETASDEAAE